MTRSLLAFSRRQSLHPVRVDLNELASGMSRLLARVLGKKAFKKHLKAAHAARAA